MAADTSSAAAGSTFVVVAAAVMLAALSAEPIPDKSVAAAETVSGVAIRNDMSPPSTQDDSSQTRMGANHRRQQKTLLRMRQICRGISRLPRRRPERLPDA